MEQVIRLANEYVRRFPGGELQGQSNRPVVLEKAGDLLALFEVLEETVRAQPRTGKEVSAELTLAFAFFDEAVRKVASLGGLPQRSNVVQLWARM